MPEIIIRPLEKMSEFTAIEDLQREAWTMTDIEVIPAHALHAMAFNGACVLGAFDEEKLVGFVFGVLGTVEDQHNRVDQVAAARLKMYSVIAGVLPDYQVHGIGYRLKMAQRDFCLRIGVRLVNWTYDPLESRNAQFNIGKLGAICHTYHRSFHGEMGGINAGLATDRFDVEWWVTSPRVQNRATQHWRPLKLSAVMGGGARLVNPSQFNAAGLLVPPDEPILEQSNMLLLEIPADFQSIKQLDFSLARRWREHTRYLFEGLFEAGYLVTDFISEPGPDGRRRSYYLLTYQDT